MRKSSPWTGQLFSLRNALVCSGFEPCGTSVARTATVAKTMTHASSALPGMGRTDPHLADRRAGVSSVRALAQAIVARVAAGVAICRPFAGLQCGFAAGERARARGARAEPHAGARRRLNRVGRSAH